MGLRSLVQSLYLSTPRTVERPSALYDVGANTIFTVVGGSVLIHALFAHYDAAITAGSTGRVTINGVNADSGALAMAGVINSLWMEPLDDTLPPVIALAGDAPALPWLSSPGNIVLTVGIAITDGAITWYVVFTPVDVAANII